MVTRATRPDLHLIAACSDRKKAGSTTALRLRDVPDGDAESRAKKWIAIRDSSESSSAKPAERLYAGDHWNACLRLRENALGEGYTINLWAASAGYGLLHADDLVIPYAATFARTHDDSVLRGVTPSEEPTTLATWWSTMNLAQSGRRLSRTTIGQIAASDPETPIIVVASRQYLLAMAPDLATAAKHLCPKELLSIVSVGAGEIPCLKPFLIDCDSTLQHLVGGALHSLNARIASRAIREALNSGLGASRPILQEVIDHWEKRALTKYDRKTRSDYEIASYIRDALTTDPNLTHTALLRRFRDAGNACEQTRFRDIFRTEKTAVTPDA